MPLSLINLELVLKNTTSTCTCECSTCMLYDDRLIIVKPFFLFSKVELSPIRMQYLVIITALCAIKARAQDLTSPSEIITIGGVLSSTSAQTVFENSISQLNLQPRIINIYFNSTSIIMDPNPIQSAIKLCDNVVSQGVQVMVVSHPPGGSSQPPISVSYTCGFYQIPVIGISARDSAFSDKVHLYLLLSTCLLILNMSYMYVILILFF